MSWHLHGRDRNGRAYPCAACGKDVKPSGSAMLDAVRLPGGGMMLAEQLDRELNFNPNDDSAAFYNKPDFEQRYLDVLEQKNTMAEHGDLPPVVTDPNAMKVLEAALTKE